MEDSQSPHRKIGSLEAARGIAALAVAAYHCGDMKWSHGNLLFDSYDRGNEIAGPISLVIATACNGPAAVTFFFVLSGFVLAMSASRSERLDWKWAWQFLTARLLRIYPAVLACLTLLCVIYAATGMHLSTQKGEQAFAPINVLLNFCLVRTDLNGVLWTLRVELLAIPIVILAIKLFRIRSRFWLCVLSCGLFLLAVDRHLPRILNGDSSHTFLFSFVAGVGGYELFKERKLRLSPNQSFWILLFSLALLISVRPHILGFHSKWNQVAESFCAVVIIACCSYGPRTCIQNILEKPWLKLVGEYSYSF